MKQRWPRAIAILLFTATVGGVALTSACGENPVGRKCFLGALEGDSDTTVVVASPALECQSRTCLRIPLPTGAALPDGSEFASLCTAECESEADCDRVPESPCQTGFTCGVATAVGNFCCRKLCMCKDYLILPDDGVLITPEACDPENTDNMCANLPNRS